MWNLLRDLGTRLLRDLMGSSRERQELLAAQIRLNERETENAPSSVLRLWRSFLGWVLALIFCWEVPVRLLLLPLLAGACYGAYFGKNEAITPESLAATVDRFMASHPDAADRVRTDGNIEPSAAEAAALARENAAAKAAREREAAEAGTGAATTPTEA